MSCMRAQTHSRLLSSISVKTPSTMTNDPRRSCRPDVLRENQTTRQSQPRPCNGALITDYKCEFTSDVELRLMMADACSVLAHSLLMDFSEGCVKKYLLTVVEMIDVICTGPPSASLLQCKPNQQLHC